MKLFTIGFTKRNAEYFFETLKRNWVKHLFDIRLNNISQLAGFTKRDDLKYFLKIICDISYQHKIKFAPTEETMKAYKNGEITWKEFEKIFTRIIEERNAKAGIEEKDLENTCLLCSEFDYKYCHRKIVAEYLEKEFKDVEIVHI